MGNESAKEKSAQPAAKASSQDVGGNRAAGSAPTTSGPSAVAVPTPPDVASPLTPASPPSSPAADFTYRQDSSFPAAAPAPPPPAPSNFVPQAHPTLGQLPPAFAALPAVHQAIPLRLTPDAIAATAFHWQRPPIGHGGFSNVYEGLFYQRPVAVKVLTIRNPQERAMFEEELRSLLNPSLWHHNICPLLAFCDAAPAFVFPKLSPLSRDRLSRLPLGVRDCVCHDVALGMAHMHAAGYVHSDMKPDNVLIEFDAQRVIRRALVGDMGCVKSCAVPVVPFGTIVFLDPGLPANTPRHPHPADDVYSLGLTFLAIYLGLFPERREDIAAMDGQLAQSDPPRSQLVRSMIQRDAALRPTCASAVETLRALRAAPITSTGAADGRPSAFASSLRLPVQNNSQVPLASASGQPSLSLPGAAASPVRLAHAV